MNHRRTLAGFTLVELLVVIAIIGVLVALLLPAVQTAREAARRTQCKNHFKQLGLALHNYHDIHKILPPAIQFWNGDDARTSDNMRPNWVILILPYMEQLPLYESFDFNETISHANNRTQRGTKIAGMLCPSDGFNRTKFKGLTTEEGDNWQRGNYAANGHADFIQNNGFSDDKRRGVMGVNVSLRFSQITDGLTNALMAGEVRSGLTDEDRRGTWAMGTAGACALFKHGCGGDANGPNAPYPESDDIEGCDILYTTPGEKRLNSQRMGCWRTCNASQQATVRSQHPGGTVILMCDGSVHFISETVETTGEGVACSTPEAIWDRLISSGDGEVVPGDVLH
ncbi:Type II secretion system protein G precursor [Anatilimnocola aggregata]|uniref:Type II secretion system protein G n=1 Tax=Anatilimnocola aggregata TaxID=2528021 RepID=A0A517YCP0_9BACT|nr:DUF1559 domain-containing protein [Anatilimnocola aggregata]QDU28007.1 Type II secretion system protein G precursor [Anatilimnocola aggregata]